VGLAAAAGPAEYQPPFGLLGVFLRSLITASESLLIMGIAAAPPGQQLIEGEAGQWPQVAVPLEPTGSFLLEFFFNTPAGHQSAKVRVPQGYIESQPTPAHAEWALILFLFPEIAIS